MKRTLILLAIIATSAYSCKKNAEKCEFEDQYYTFAQINSSTLWNYDWVLYAEYNDCKEVEHENITLRFMPQAVLPNTYEINGSGNNGSGTYYNVEYGDDQMRFVVDDQTWSVALLDEHNLHLHGYIGKDFIVRTYYHP